MRRLKFGFVLLILLLFWGCEPDPLAVFPVIHLEEQQTKQFIFTNKNNGYFLGNSHRQNDAVHQGWTVNNIPYLHDYRIEIDGLVLKRDSLIAFKYYPFSIVRHYPGDLTETFTVLDSLDALIWELESKRDVSGLIFEPVLHGEASATTPRLWQQNTTVLFSPQQMSPEMLQANWMGFSFFRENARRIVIVAVLAKDKTALTTSLEDLSQSYFQKKTQRIERMNTLLQKNSLFTNIPEISDAVAWAQYALDALISTHGKKELWSGLPGLNTTLGRDTFISLKGAFLLSGDYAQAREIFNTFAAFQISDEQNPMLGRIPNKISDQAILYDAADVTWWFVRGVYEYLTYSGDIDFGRQIFPVVKRAINGALRYRIDKNFLLLHGGAETWMAQKDLSPRENRAVEIQSLWYSALQIGAFLARLNNEPRLSDHWLAIVKSVGENFRDLYWNSYNYRLYDHINPDGSADKRIRPNQRLALTVPDLPNMEPLLGLEKQARISSEVVQKLTYRYGVASLWQGDKDFLPAGSEASSIWLDDIHYNGAVWTWLTGPMISSLVKFYREDLAYLLYLDQVHQVYDLDALGNLGQGMSALPKPGEFEPKITGSVSFALSLAEFVRTFFQDFVGYEPDAMMSKIQFRPHFNRDLNYVSTYLPYRNSKIYFSYYNTGERFQFEIRRSAGLDSASVTLAFSGYDSINFSLNDKKSNFVIAFVPEERRSYKQYPELDWDLARPFSPDSLQNIPAVK